MFDFRDLFIFEMANNHQGRVDHGVRIIREMGKIAKDRGIRAAIKFQFRDLDTFVASVPPSKHIKRFLETRLTREQFMELILETEKQGLVTMTTPFDEPSVELAIGCDIQIIKIGSPSADDWPLIRKVAEEAAKAGKPVVFSTGGLTMAQIDDVSAFFDSKGVHHAIMHCVSLYPTPAEHFQLNQIAALCRRYPNKVIGFSSHEGRWQTSPITLAYALGARLFERHVGIEEKSSVEYGGTPSGVTLNAYSADPADVRGWLDDYEMAKKVCGATERPESAPEEQEALRELKRNVAGPRYVGDPGSPERIIHVTTQKIKAMLAEAKIALPTDFKLEFSHHMGLVMFPYVGATIIEIVNRAYCKKLIIMMPGQRHPEHYHTTKEETFHVLSGNLHININQKPRTLYPGDTALIQSGEFHHFWTDSGAIVEEISTTHQNGDSYYLDPLIKALKREERKTIVENWGRFQF